MCNYISIYDLEISADEDRLATVAHVLLVPRLPSYCAEAGTAGSGSGSVIIVSDLL